MSGIRQFVPHLEKEAHAQVPMRLVIALDTLSISLYSSPKLGDPKELFEYYSDKIKGDDLIGFNYSD